MKTIEQMASDIAYSQCKAQGKNPHCKSIDSSNCPTCGVGISVYNGCIKMSEFTQRWRDPKTEKPEADELVQVKIKILATRNDSIGYDHDKFNLEHQMFEIEQMCGLEIIGWRPIELK